MTLLDGMLHHCLLLVIEVMEAFEKLHVSINEQRQVSQLCWRDAAPRRWFSTY
jgi:hypothetical protein